MARAVIWKCQLLPKARDRLPGTPHPSTGLCGVIASLGGVGWGSPMSWKPFCCQLGALGPGGLESNPSSATSQLGSPGKASPRPVFTHKTRIYGVLVHARC